MGTAIFTTLIGDGRCGKGEDTDMLTISPSVNDYIGHGFGPYSPQVADVTLRTDRYLASFFGELDKLVGLGHVWIALSADHGVSPNPAFIREHNLSAGAAAFLGERFQAGHLLQPRPTHRPCSDTGSGAGADAALGDTGQSTG